MQDTLVLTLEKAKFLVDQAIEQRGEDYLYKKEGDDEYAECLYVHNVHEWDDELCGMVETGEKVAGCLVGLALHKGGVPLEVLERHEGSGAHELCQYLNLTGHVEASDDAKEYLFRVQRSQDHGKTWGEARSLAEQGLSWDGTRTDGAIWSTW